MTRGRWQRVLLLELASRVLDRRGLRYGREGGGQGWRAPLLSPRKRAAQPQASAGRRRRVVMCEKWDRRGCGWGCGRRLSPLAPTTRICIRNRICGRLCVPDGHTSELRRHGLEKKKGESEPCKTPMIRLRQQYATAYTHQMSKTKISLKRDGRTKRVGRSGEER